MVLVVLIWVGPLFNYLPKVRDFYTKKKCMEVEIYRIGSVIVFLFILFPIAIKTGEEGLGVLSTCHKKFYSIT